MDAMAAQLATSAALTRLQGIWLYRMIFTPHPLRERMTLFWHNHFATSNRQGQQHRLDAARRTTCCGPTPWAAFAELLAAIGRDPAMLIWLDSTANRKAQAQRELRPRGDGAVHPRPGPLHRARHPGGSPRLHRLVRPGGRFREIAAQHDDGDKDDPGPHRPIGRRRHPGDPARAAGLRRVPLHQARPGLRQRGRPGHRPSWSPRWPSRSASRATRSGCPWE